MRDLNEVVGLTILVRRIYRAMERIEEEIDGLVGRGDCDELTELWEQLQQVTERLEEK